MPARIRRAKALRRWGGRGHPPLLRIHPSRPGGAAATGRSACGTPRRCALRAARMEAAAIRLSAARPLCHGMPTGPNAGWQGTAPGGLHPRARALAAQGAGRPRKGQPGRMSEDRAQWRLHGGGAPCGRASLEPCRSPRVADQSSFLPNQLRSGTALSTTESTPATGTDSTARRSRPRTTRSASSSPPNAKHAWSM